MKTASKTENEALYSRKYSFMGRSQLFLGCDRSMLCLVLLVHVSTAFSFPGFVSITCNTALLLAEVFLLRKAARYDPMFLKILIRRLEYRQRDYPARQEYLCRNHKKP
ncbi:MAG TPA: hypothetical protein DCR21_07535 [Succinivibrionaceae bacterium]|nr:VirB3 family type IV secretion system protein [Succinivibrio sp.]HAR80667.1 hypothetical protein [Succinivibrionaceae bacterium]